MAILDKWTLDFTSNSVTQTERLGVRLGELLRPVDLICLSGDLGAGKTALARGIGRGWGTTLRVTSPTFTLVNQYPRPRDGRILYHIDGYRLETWPDVSTVGLEDILDGHNPAMVEWPERILPLLRQDALWFWLSYLSETRRSLRISAKGPQAVELFETFRRSAFGV